MGISTLLTVSETFSAFWDSVGQFVAQYWPALAGSISIPAVIAFITRYIMYKVKNNKTIHNAITQATNAVAGSTDVLGAKIDTFEAKATQLINDIEAKMEEKIDMKFAELKSKRIEAYNHIMKGKEFVEEKLEDVKEVASDIKNLANQVQETYEALPNEEPKIDEIIDKTKANLSEKMTDKQIIKDKKKSKKVSQNQLLI